MLSYIEGLSVNEIIGQALTLLYYLIYWYATCLKSKKNILILRNIGNLVNIVSFLFLKAPSGLACAFFDIIRNRVGREMDTKSAKTRLSCFLALLCIMIAILTPSYFGFGISEPNGIGFIAVMLCGILNLIAVFLDKQKMRLLNVTGGVCWLVYQFSIGNLSGVICEAITDCVLLMSFIVCHIKETKLNN